MTENERLLRVAGLMTLLRDDLEELQVEKELKRATNMWLKKANHKMNQLASGGEKSNEELMDIVQRFDKILKIDLVEELKNKKSW